MLAFFSLIGLGIGKAWRWVTSSGHWKIVAVALTVIALALLIQGYRNRGAEIATLTDDLNVAKGEVALLRQSREADSSAMTHAVKAKTKIHQKEAVSRARTEVALEANPDWAQQPIPADVLDSLRD